MILNLACIWEFLWVFIYRSLFIGTLCCFREIDLLKEQNIQLQKTVDERMTKVAALEEELKKARECKADNEVKHFFCWNCALFHLFDYFVIDYDNVEWSRIRLDDWSVSIFMLGWSVTVSTFLVSHFVQLCDLRWTVPSLVTKVWSPMIIFGLICIESFVIILWSKLISIEFGYMCLHAARLWPIKILSCKSGHFET